MARVVLSQRRKERVRAVALASRRRALDLGKDLWNAISAYVSSSLAMLSLVLVIVVAVSHSVDDATGFIHDVAKKYPGNVIFAWMSTFFPKFLGLLAFVPTLLSAPKRSYPVAIGIVVLVCIACMPQANFYQYMGLSLIAHFYAHAVLPSTRLIVLCALVIYVTVLHGMLASVGTPSEHLQQIVRSTSTVRRMAENIDRGNHVANNPTSAAV